MVMVPVVGQITLSCDILKPASTTAMCATVCLADEPLAVACPLAQPPLVEGMTDLHCVCREPRVLPAVTDGRLIGVRLTTFARPNHANHLLRGDV